MKSFLMILVLGLGQCLYSLDTPTPITPKSGAPKVPLYQWTAVPNVEYYIIRQWAVDAPACSPKGFGHTYENENPRYYLFPAKKLCDGKTCSVQRKIGPASANYWSPTTQITLFLDLTQSLFLNLHPQSNTLLEIDPARGCDGKPFVWHWSIQAAAKWDAATKSFAELSPESSQVEYWRDDSVQSPTPAQPPPKPKPDPSKPHTVTFVNKSGMPLYVYYFIRVGGTVDCKDYANGGTMQPEGTAKFEIPGDKVGHFVFQKAQDPCPLSTIFQTRDVLGANAPALPIAIGP